MTPNPTRSSKNDPSDDISCDQAHSPATPEDAPEGVRDEDETDNGPPRAGRDPMRKCIATGERALQSTLIRLVLDPDGVVTPDLTQRLPGRGAWITPGRDAIAKALAAKAFNRAFKQQVKTPENLVEQVEDLMVKRCLSLLGFAKRSGDLILGADMVREEVRSARPACLIEALDGAEDGRRKVLALARGLHQKADLAREIPLIGCFSARELGLALGRERVIHALVKKGRFAGSWLSEVHRLSGFRELVPTDWKSVEH